VVELGLVTDGQTDTGLPALAQRRAVKIARVENCRRSAAAAGSERTETRSGSARCEEILIGIASRRTRSTI